MRRILVALLLLTSLAQADQLWKADDQSLTIKLPDGFAKPKSAVPVNPVGDPVLFLYDKANNVTFMASARKQAKVSTKDFEKELGAWLTQVGGKMVDSSSVKAGWRPGHLYVLSGHNAEAIESVLIYIPLSGSSQVLLFNFPARQREKALKLATSAVSTLRLK